MSLKSITDTERRQKWKVKKGLKKTQQSASAKKSKEKTNGKRQKDGGNVK